MSGATKHKPAPFAVAANPMNLPPANSDSHEFEFRGHELIRLLAPTLTGFAVMIVLLQSLNHLAWLPEAAPVASSDEVLMRRRLEMTQAESPAQVLVIGDSSSSIDVEAPLLGGLLPGAPEVLNQGMFMGIGMDIYGEAAGEFIRRHPGQVKLVLLLMTAEQLQNAYMSPVHQRLWREGLAGGAQTAGRSTWRDWIALGPARDRLAGHLVPFVLHGHASLFYAHPLHLRRYLQEHGGSTVETGIYNPASAAGATVYRVTDQVLREAALLRLQIPSDVRLVAGITPLPDSVIPASFRVRRDELLQELNRALRADQLLTNLPVRLPNGFFASPFHLNPRGAEHFTRALADELSKLPVWDSDRDSGRP